MENMEKIYTILLAVMAAAMFIHGIIKGKHRHHHRSFGHKHGGSILSVDYYAYASGLRKWDGAFKAGLSLVCLFLCLLCNNNYVSVAVILMMGYLVVVLGGLGFDHYISMLTVPIIFLIFGSVAIAIGFSLKPMGQYHLSVFHLFYIFCSDESLLKTARLILKALGAVSCLYMMTLTTPLSELIVVMRKAHVPKLLVELMNMIYRYIFIMMDTHSRMKNSAESRLGYVDFKTSCYSFGQVASNLFVVSLKRGTNYYNALESRCYDGDLRFLEEEKTVTKGQWITAAVILAILLFFWAGSTYFCG